MTEISDEDLLRLNQQGLIPGPNENEADFLKRIEQTSSFPMEMDPSLGKPSLLKKLYSESTFSGLITSKLFDFFPGDVYKRQSYLSHNEREL